jgi:serine phosphatase RsbU (regulator of sigma subunit)
MAGKFPMDMNATRGAAVALRTGRSEVYTSFPQKILERAATSDEHLEVIRQLGMSSGIVVPLTGRSGTFGVITLVHAESGRLYDPSDLPFVEDIARRAALALETATTFREQSGRLANVTQVAEAAQLAILAAPPSRIGAVSLAARYVSAAAEALIGGDLYEVVQGPGSVRMLIGDVRGKGLTAVRTATIVLGEFRAAAADVSDLRQVSKQIDRRLRPYLADEDFVTALIAEIGDDGRFQVVSCGHPPALLAAGGVVTELPLEHALPLGLGTEPTVHSGQLEPGDRLLLYTDGAIEARDANGQFIDLMEIVQPIAATDLEDALDQVLEGLHSRTGPELGDDLALLIAEYKPD